jgi:hypothetical protein
MYNTKKSSKYIQELHVCINNYLYKQNYILYHCQNNLMILYTLATPLSHGYNELHHTLVESYNPFKLHLHQIQIFIVRPFNIMECLHYHVIYKHPHSFIQIFIVRPFNIMECLHYHVIYKHPHSFRNNYYRNPK